MKFPRELKIGCGIFLLIALTICLIPVWLPVVDSIIPDPGREERIAIATEYLEAYSREDCPEAFSLMNTSFFEFHSDIHYVWVGQGAFTPLRFCTDKSVHIVQIDRVRDVKEWFFVKVDRWMGVALPSPTIAYERQVIFTGIFDVSERRREPYQCSRVSAEVLKDENGRWVVDSWSPHDEECDMTYGDWRKLPTKPPECQPTDEVSMVLESRGKSHILVRATGLIPNEWYYVVYGPKNPNPLIDDTIWGWAEQASPRGELLYHISGVDITDEPSIWTVRLAHWYGVECEEITLPGESKPD